MLNKYFGYMIDALMEEGGILDKFIGDAIMAVFGVPSLADDGAVQTRLATTRLARSRGLPLHAPPFPRHLRVGRLSDWGCAVPAWRE